MAWNKPPTLKQFAELFNDYLREVGCMNNPDGYIASHKIVGGIHVYNVDKDDDTEYEIVGLDVGQLGGCGCWSDIIIEIRKVKEQDSGK